MANKELWEIELDIKTDKVNAAQKKYDESLRGITEKQKRLTATLLKELKVQTADELTESLKRRKIALNEVDEKLSASKKLQQQQLRDSKLTGQSSPISNYGVTELKGSVGSSAYVSQLKALRSEISPTSAEFKSLSATINQYEAELNKVNKSTGLMGWKQLNTSIKETKGELARLTAESKVGTAEWEKYSNKLRELQRNKQLIQRETKLTSQQLMAMSRDLTVVSFGVRAIITDIAGLGDGKKSAGELAMAIGGIGLQLLTVLPAIHGLTTALEASGIVSAATIAKLASLSATLGTLAGGIAVVTAAYGLMAGAITHITDIFGRLSSVMSGQMGYWDSVKENIKDVTFGLLDFTDASNNFDSSNVQQQLSDLAYIANFTANSFADLKLKVDDAVNTNRNKLLAYYTLTKNPLSFAGPDISDQDRLNARLKLDDSKKSKKGGSPKTSKQEKEEELNLIKLQEAEYKKLETQLAKNLGDLGSENKLLLQMLDIEREIFKLRYGTDVSFKNLPDAKGINTDNIPGLNLRKGFKLKSSNAGDNRPDMSSEEMKTIADEMKRKEEGRLGLVNQMYDSTKGMLSDFGLMKGTTAEIVNFLDSLISGASKGFSLVSSLIGFATNPIGTIIGTASGGGGFNGAGHALGMGYNGGSMPNIGMPNNKPLVAPVIIKNPISLGKGMEVINNYDATRGTIDI